VFFGAIGVGKSTITQKLKKYLEKQNLKVYLPEELSLQLKNELKLFYKDPKKYGFFFQDMLIDTYQKNYKDINMEKYDYVFLERTHIDTKIFTTLNIDDTLKLDYLEKKCSMVDVPNFNKVIFIKCDKEFAVKRQLKRKRKEEKNCESEYVKRVCQAYVERANELYPDHVVLDTSYKRNKNVERFKQSIVDLADIIMQDA
jgi:deoxyadenosine/deoxycytidine kinase